MKIYAIAKVTFLQIIRQPIFGVLLILALGIMTLAPSVTAFTLDDDNKMLQDLCLSTILVSGLLLAAFSASGAISAEIDDQTILTIVSKPINRLAFIAGKFLGVMGAGDVLHDAVKGDRPPVQAQLSSQEVHESGLAGPILPDQRVHLARVHVEAHPVQRLHAGEVLRDALKSQYGLRGRNRCFWHFLHLLQAT
jgi:hypothetical protein